MNRKLLNEKGRKHLEATLVPFNSAPRETHFWVASSSLNEYLNFNCFGDKVSDLVWPWICSVAKTDLELLTLHPYLLELLELRFHGVLGDCSQGFPILDKHSYQLSYTSLTLLKNITFSSQFYKEDKIWRKILKISYILFIICIVDVLPKRYWKINSKSMESKNDFGGWQ